MRSGVLIAAFCIAGAVADTEFSNPKIARRADEAKPLGIYRQRCVDQCFEAMKKNNGIPNLNNNLLKNYCTTWCLSLKFPPTVRDIEELCKENIEWRWLLTPQRPSN